ncbi:hypothetical protein [uncultured Roseibium sp.]|uniref:hypothetical protein n=1 Tax=uncultured Roseibium sp. TaxID=1936171 RepID=UPI002602B03B|nr:hypothetical protein [uncultured Roseibium sp.]
MPGEVRESGNKAGAGKSRQATGLPEELLGHADVTSPVPDTKPGIARPGPAEDEHTGRSAPPGHTISDQKFNKDLATLRGLHSFLIREATTLPENFSLGELNCLKAARATVTGRAPSDSEWQAVEKKTQILFALLTDANRKRFLVSQMPTFLPTIVVWLVAISIGSMILSVLMAAEVSIFSKGVDVALMVLFFLLWLMSLGAIGSAAFIGFNAISVTSDITFDISDTRLIIQRIVLGALFALFFTLPFGFHEFLSFVKSLSNSALNKTTVPTRSEIAFTNQSLLLLMPFVLGYSTSLVILILNRMISAASTLFGAQSASAQGKAVSK